MGGEGPRPTTRRLCFGFATTEMSQTHAGVCDTLPPVARAAGAPKAAPIPRAAKTTDAEKRTPRRRFLGRKELTVFRRPRWAWGTRAARPLLGRRRMIDDA